MWCGTCQSDVVTEVASDHRRVSCSICGATLGETVTSQETADDSSPRSAKTTQARELLDRWAKSPLFDPYGPVRTGSRSSGRASHATSSIPVETDTSVEPAADSEPSATSDGAAPPSASSEELDRLTQEILSRVARITDSIRQPAPAAAHPAKSDTPTESGRDDDSAGSPNEIAPASSSPSPEPARRIDAGHATTWQDEAPQQSSRSFDAAGNPITTSDEQLAHGESANRRTNPAYGNSSTPTPQAAIPQSGRETLSSRPRKSGFVGGIGQVLAYLGILGLTAGTSLVIVGYFGGPAHYAPTGWLVTTIGQMMLFLGVVTLVSTGMEQTQAEVRESLDETLREVSSRIDQLGQRLTRIDASAHKTPPAPHSLMRTQSPQESSSSLRD